MNRRISGSVRTGLLLLGTAMTGAGCIPKVTSESTFEEVLSRSEGATGPEYYRLDPNVDISLDSTRTNLMFSVRDAAVCSREVSVRTRTVVERQVEVDLTVAKTGMAVAGLVGILAGPLAGSRSVGEDDVEVTSPVLFYGGLVGGLSLTLVGLGLNSPTRHQERVVSEPDDDVLTEELSCGVELPVAHFPIAWAIAGDVAPVEPGAWRQLHTDTSGIASLRSTSLAEAWNAGNPSRLWIRHPSAGGHKDRQFSRTSATDSLYWRVTSAWRAQRLARFESAAVRKIRRKQGKDVSKSGLGLASGHHTCTLDVFVRPSGEVADAIALECPVELASAYEREIVSSWRYATSSDAGISRTRVLDEFRIK